MRTQVKASRKPRPRPERFVSLSKAVGGCHALLLRVGKEACGYWLEPIAADQGQAFQLTKFAHCQEEGEPSSYHVNLHGPAGHSCECKGHLRWGHKTLCKHLAALLKLIAEGSLPGKLEGQRS